MSRGNRRRACALALAALAAAPGSGCVRRTISVRSDPPGARVFVDGALAGETPCEIPFAFYGTRELILRAPGREPASLRLALDPPLWQLPPADFLVELLLPLTIRDKRRVFAALAPARPPAPSEVRARAEAARAGAASGR